MHSTCFYSTGGAHAELRLCLVGISAPPKKILPPPPKNSPQTPPPAAPPPPARETPPLWGFSIKKPSPPPLPAPWTPPTRKNKKYPKRPPSLRLQPPNGTKTGTGVHSPKQPFYETAFYLPVICSESIFGAFKDLFRVLLQKCLTVLGAPPKLTGNPDLP